MPKDLTFSVVCDFIKKDDGELIENVDNFLGLAIVCSPAIFGSAALPALKLIGAKNVLTSIGKKLLSKITSKEESDYVSRMHRMEVAYGLICYTAFFDALDNTLSDDLRKEIALQPLEKLYIAEQEKGCLPDDLLLELKGPFIEPLFFPHPTSSFEEIKDFLTKLYKQMSKNFEEFVGKLSVLENADDNKLESFQASIKALPDEAIKCFEAQYFELSRKYEEFRIWVQINDRKNMSAYLTKYHTLLTEANEQIDIGFDDLNKTISSIPNRLKKIESQNVVDGLKRRYLARIEEAVIEDKDISASDKPSLTFPRISEAFIPQSYRVLRYMTKSIHLEKEETWNRLTQKHDISAFLLSFLSSPFSIEAPLLILGHPGGGKSLLTKVLSAKLMSNTYIPIRIPLREVDAELSIEALVEMQIEIDTQCRISSWADFASQFPDRPLLIVLDGFDELLQASGTVFAGFLDKLQKFQQDQIVHKHPARVIVTSRITLIDKAAVPIGTTVLRLLEFTEKQRNTWITIWNRVNARYFELQKPSVKPFSLSKEKKRTKKNKILELAEQPLLLLMLALYDSEDNSLRNNTQIDRTLLYDSLLRRFVRRERRRYVKDFDHLNDSEQNKEIDNEMKRLGVAAIGMYNRRKLHVLSSDLSGDLKFFELDRKLHIPTGRPLTEADLLLGSFFFIHKSSAGDAEEEHSTNDTAFEFLHNTFGEFLTADFILRFAFQETEALHSLKKEDNLRSVLQQKLQDPNGLAKEWFACFMYSPLYLRPVIPEMIREWSGHLFKQKKFSRKNFLNCFDEILNSQVKMLLDSRAFPDIMRQESPAQFVDTPLLGLIATYTLNLIILRAIIDESEFIFNEADYSFKKLDSDSEDRGTRPWDKITKIWRAWFRIENLSGLSAILSATRDGDKVILKGRSEFRARSGSDQLNTVLNVAVALGDNITIGLAGLHTRNIDTNHSLSLDKLEACLNNENIDLSFEFLVRRLRTNIAQPAYTSHDADELILKGLEEVFQHRQSNNLVIAFFDLFEKTIRQGFISFQCRRNVQKELMHPRRIMELIEFYPEVAIECMRILRELGKHYMDFHYYEEFFERVMNPKEMMRMMEKRPELAIEWMRLVRELGGGRWIERYGEEFFERAMHPKEMMRMMERRPELAIEWIGLIRELNGSRWIDRYGEEFFERTLHPKEMIRMMERRPGLAIEWMRLIRELGGSRWIDRYGKEFFENAMHPKEMIRLIERQPELAIEWMRLIRELGGSRWIDRYGKEFFEHTMHPREMLRLMERRPELAIEWVRLIRELGSERWIDQYSEEFFERAMHPKEMMRMMERRPELAIEWIRLIRELGGDRWIDRYGEEFFERAIHPKEMMRLMERRPELAIEWINLMKNIGGKQLLNNLGKYIRHEVHPEHAAIIFAKSQESALTLIKILHLSDSKNFLHNFQCEYPENRQFDVAKVPLDLIESLKWYAKEVKNTKLLQTIDNYIKKMSI